MTGALATLVATPCTAPFMAAAIGFALTLPPAEALLVFEMVGLGLASPFLLISFFPPLRRILPKPGAWMEKFRHILAWPMYLTSLWLLWVLMVHSGAGALTNAVRILILLSALAVGLRQIQQPFSRAVWIFSLIGLSGWLLATLPEEKFGLAFLPIESKKQAPVESFSLVRLEELRAQGTPVFVDVSAAWCLTCRVNEHFTLSKPLVRKHFEEQKIVTLIADWTKQDEVISAYLNSFQRQGVPMYVYYAPSGEPALLPQLLTPELVIKATGG